MATRTDITSILLRDINEDIEIINEKDHEEGTDIEWKKDLKGLPVFTIREIEEHRLKSGKNNNSIMKTTERGKKFKEERYLSSNDIFVKK